MSADLLTDETLGVLLRWTPAGPRKRIEAHIAALRADRDAARELAEGWRLSGLQETTMRIRAEVDRDTLLDALTAAAEELDAVALWLGRFDTTEEAIDEDDGWDTALLASAFHVVENVQKSAREALARVRSHTGKDPA